MGELYHGSSNSGLKRLEPKKSTHGTYVYATPYKELAILFSKKCGDNLTYSLYRNNNDEPWQIVERIPNGFETMFDNEASIYTLSDSTFMDINTGFSELVSEVGVDILKEEKVPRVLDAIKILEKEGLVKLYKYPNRPNDIPLDDSDLLIFEVNYSKTYGRELDKKSFKRMIYLHPNMLELINEELKSNGLDLLNENDIIEAFKDFVVRKLINPSQECYIDSAFTSISSVYPSLIPQLENSLSLFKKNKEEKIELILEHISNSFPNIPKDIIDQTKKTYINDKRDFSQIREELRNEINKMISISETYSKDIVQDIKSSIAK